MNKLILFCLMSFMVLYPVAGYSLSLGQIKVYSAANEPLRAEIEILAANPEWRASDLHAKLATPSLFKQFGIKRIPELDQIRFVTAIRKGERVVVISSRGPFAANGTEFLLQVEGESEKTLKKYRLNLQKARSVPQQPAPAPIPKPKLAPKPVPQQPLALQQPLAPKVAAREFVKPLEINNTVPAADPVLTQQGASTFIMSSRQLPVVGFDSTEGEQPIIQRGQGGGDKAASSLRRQQTPVKSTPSAKRLPTRKKYYTIKKGDTLYKVAAANKYAGVRTEQMLLAMFKKNSRFFSRRSINQLEIGDRLKLPSRNEAKAISRTEARKFETRLRQGKSPVETLAEKKAAKKSAKKAVITAQKKKVKTVTAKQAPVPPKAAIAAVPPKKSEPVQRNLASTAVQSKPVVNAQNNQGNVQATSSQQGGKQNAVNADKLVELQQKLSDLQRLIKIKDEQQRQLHMTLKQKNRLLFRQRQANNTEKFSGEHDAVVNAKKTTSLQAAVPILPVTRITPPIKVAVPVSPAPKTTAIKAAVPAAPQPLSVSTQLVKSKNQAEKALGATNNDVTQPSLMTKVGRFIIEYPMQVILFCWLLFLSWMIFLNRKKDVHTSESVQGTPKTSDSKASAAQLVYTLPDPLIYSATVSRRNDSRRLALKKPSSHWREQRGELRSSIVPLQDNIFELEKLSTELKYCRNPIR